METVLEGRGDSNYWDDFSAHTPKLKFFDGKYYLYYIGTNAGKKGLREKELIETAITGYNHENWSTLRSRIHIRDL